MGQYLLSPAFSEALKNSDYQRGTIFNVMLPVMVPITAVRFLFLDCLVVQTCLDKVELRCRVLCPVNKITHESLPSPTAISIHENASTVHLG